MEGSVEAAAGRVGEGGTGGSRTGEQAKRNTAESKSAAHTRARVTYRSIALIFLSLTMFGPLEIM
jgi:hypothetical protein